MFTHLTNQHCHFIDEADDWQQTQLALIFNVRGSITSMSKELKQLQSMTSPSFLNIFNKMNDVECSAFLSGHIFGMQSGY